MAWQRYLSYINQYIDLKRKSMDWFLHDRDLHQEKVKLSRKLLILLFIIKYLSSKKSWVNTFLNILQSHLKKRFCSAWSTWRKTTPLGGRGESFENMAICYTWILWWNTNFWANFFIRVNKSKTNLVLISY